MPDAVINKPGKLTDEEFAAMKSHPVMGAKILGNIRERPELVTGARWHHERFADIMLQMIDYRQFDVVGTSDEVGGD